MRRMLLALVLAMIPTNARAEVNPHDLTTDQRTQLVTCQNAIRTINELQGKKLLNDATANACRQSYLQCATVTTGRDFTEEGLDAYMAEATKSIGFGIFLNSLIVLAGIALLLAVIGLIAYYFWSILVRLPLGFYEAAAYGLATLLLLSGLLWSPFDLWFLRIHPLWLVVPGAIAFPCCVMLTRMLHTARPPGRFSAVRWMRRFS